MVLDIVFEETEQEIEFDFGEVIVVSEEKEEETETQGVCSRIMAESIIPAVVSKSYVCVEEAMV